MATPAGLERRLGQQGLGGQIERGGRLLQAGFGRVERALAALIGGIVLARRDPEPEEAAE